MRLPHVATFSPQAPATNGGGRAWRNGACSAPTDDPNMSSEVDRALEKILVIGETNRVLQMSALNIFLNIFKHL